MGTPLVRSIGLYDDELFPYIRPYRVDAVTRLRRSRCSPRSGGSRQVTAFRLAAQTHYRLSCSFTDVPSRVISPV